MFHRTRIGTVEILRTRAYPIVPGTDVTKLDTSTALVEPGEYPIYREDTDDGHRYYFEMTGYVNGRGINNLGGGTFVMHNGDFSTDEEITVRSTWFSPLDWYEFLADPQTTSLVFTLDRED